MARYSVSHNKAGVNTPSTTMWQLRAPTNAVLVLEMYLSVAVAPTTGPSWNLNRPSGLGATPTTQAAERENPAAAVSTGILDVAWVTPPTLASAFLRRYATAAAIGSGVVWSWYDRPLYIPVGGGIAIQNGNPSGATLGSFNISIVFEE